MKIRPSTPLSVKIGANTTTMIKDDNNWLPQEIQDEVRRLEQLAKQLDKVTKPDNNQKMEIFMEENKECS